jgi:hypothetical protein
MGKTQQKGWRNRRRAIERLEQMGCVVDTVEKTGKFAKQKDLFGLFDIIGSKKGVSYYVQVTSNTPHTHKPYQDWSLEHSNNGLEYWQWVWYDKKGWRMFNYRFGNVIKYDERKKTK